ncbi:hypothetical protein [Paraflavitalea pollutisoli]|uniref:hypothetical protein n=1 Tax=Paraflavitalea pollutisoli TaxID=3034143 RepID=UPI0023EDDDF3|nr:hypothetical protein [Paraflavitalea sp. H1-2-19X]
MSKTLTLTEAKAKELYPAADGAFKSMLEENFGKKFFLASIMDRVKCFADACQELGIDPKSVTDLNDTKDVAAYKKLLVVVKALNEGWKANWGDSSQYKYYPWFRVAPSGFGLSYGDCDLWLTASGVGLRLCFKSSELAEYAGKQFIDLYTDFMTGE